MKNILTVVMLLFCFDVYAAQNIFTDNYLNGAARAWGAVLDGGKSGAIATHVRSANSTNLAAFSEMISTLGYNDSALTLYEVTQHTDMAYSVIAAPLAAQRRSCPFNVPGCARMRRTLVVDGAATAASTDFDSSHNGDFKTRNTGLAVRAKGYVTDGFVFGVEYSRTNSDTHDTPVRTDATSNSVTLFTQYLSAGGFFMNVGLNAGHTSWNADKIIAGVGDNDAYDTDFYSGQVNGGLQFGAGRVTITPQIGARYIHVKTERHIDAAAQAFDKWSRNMMTAMGGVRAGFDFIGSDFVVRPSVYAGGAYDAISHGDNNIRVTVINGQTYDIPVDAPSRASFSGGAGVGVYGASFAVLADYKLDLRSNYASHTGVLNLKIAF